MASSAETNLAGLALVGTIAKVLNSGNAPETTLAEAAERLRTGLPAASVTIWLREPHAMTFRGIAAPAEAADGDWRGRKAIPERPEGAERVHIVHEGEWLGVLDAEVAATAAQRDILQVAADVVAPFLGSLELSEDLAYEVELRARQIEEQRRFTSMVIDALPVGLYVVDKDYRIQMWNRRREMGTQGLRRDEVVGRPVFDVLTRQPAADLKVEFDQIFSTGEMRQMELEVPAATGERRTYRISKIPMRVTGDDISHVITIGEDVTLWHSVQQQIMQSEKLAAIGQLAAGVMHEINNPLATISACVAALQGRMEDVPEDSRAGVAEYLEIIDKEVQRCTRIVDGLLDFSRPKGKAKHQVRLTALVEDTLFLLKHHKGFRKLEIRRDLEPDLPPVQGNDEQLIQVFMAIMLNAMDAMEKGGTLTVRSGWNVERGDEVFVEFEDTGEGIPRADLPKIFEPFYTTKTQGRGTGLGLSICYGIVQDHGGRIEVESQIGLGTTFRVSLPVPLG